MSHGDLCAKLFNFAFYHDFLNLTRQVSQGIHQFFVYINVFTDVESAETSGGSSFRNNLLVMLRTVWYTVACGVNQKQKHAAIIMYSTAVRRICAIIFASVSSCRDRTIRLVQNYVCFHILQP